MAAIMPPSPEESLEIVEQTGEKIRFRNTPLFRQCLAASGLILLTACGALASGFSSVLLDQLKDPESTIKPTKAQESWIASLVPLPMALGCICGGWSMEHLGRVNSNLVACLLTMLGWTIIHESWGMGSLIVGRLITGFCVGLTSPGPACYLGEVAHPKYRGVFMACTVLGVSVGFLVAHVLGTFMTWRSIALVGALAPVPCLILLAKVPESHVWLLKRNRVVAAEKAFSWFRGRDEEAKNEWARLTSIPQNVTRSFAEVLEECKRRSFWKPFVIMNVYFVTVQFSGNNALVYYSVDIMRNAVPKMDKYLATIIVDLVRVIMCAVGCVVTKKYKVRSLTCVSGYGATASLLVLSLGVYSSTKNPDDIFLSFMSLLMLTSFIGFLNIGLRPLPWTLCGELFNPNTKGVGGGVSTCVNFLAFFLVVKTNPGLTDIVGSSGTFLIYAVITCVGTTALWYLVPETKDKTLKDIEDLFDKVEVEEEDEICSCCCSTKRKNKACTCCCCQFHKSHGMELCKCLEVELYHEVRCQCKLQRRLKRKLIFY